MTTSKSLGKQDTTQVVMTVRCQHFGTVDKYDIEDESDLDERAKEEIQDMESGPKHRSFSAKTGARRHNDVGFDIQDESDLDELAKEEEQDMKKGRKFKKKRMHQDRLVFDIEDEADIIEQAKEEAGRDHDAGSQHRKPSTATADGIAFDLEDEADYIELGKEEVQEMEKHRSE